MKKICVLFWAFGLFLFGGIGVGASELLSPAISVMQKQISLVKIGVGENAVSFSADDFENLLGDNGEAPLEIMELPSVSDGVLKLGALDVTPGQAIARGELSSLRFLPAAQGKTANFSFKPSGNTYENAFVCTVYMLDSLNFAPNARDMTVEAKEDISVFSSLSAEDPDGDAVSFQIIDLPKKGSLTRYDKETGEYCYTANRAGEDRFTYVAIDRYGNRSEPATVTIKTSLNKDNIVYSDMANNRCQLAAIEMAERDVIVGEKIGDVRLFYPEKTVTRADFLIMAMRAMNLDTHLMAANETGFSDADQFTKDQNRYIATARRLGLIVGMDTENGRCFCPNEMITSAQAATLLGRIAHLQELSFGDAVHACVGGEDEISDDGYAMLASVGLVASQDRTSQITRAQAAMLLYTLTLCQ